MQKSKYISICIPAYKRVAFLQRLLESISIQSFKDFEVIVTDDSPDDSVEQVCKNYNDKFPLLYNRNSQTMGTPENWNEAIRHAKGEWIKLMHDDDWFSDEYSLEKYVSAIQQNSSAAFFFSGYQNVNADTNERKNIYINSFKLERLLKTPNILVSGNVIGPPSVVIYKNDSGLWYDKDLKWLVDIDFYIRYLKQNIPVYLKDILVNIGINKQQITSAVFKDPSVEIPENFALLNKMGLLQLCNILIYDAWWRLLRKLEIKNEQDIRQAGYNGFIHPVIVSMVKWQKSIPRVILTKGFFSKGLMMTHYLLHRNQLIR